eukprot:12886491-Prorocentrum_lima.AAC.1
MGESPLPETTKILGSSSASSGATAHFGVTSEGRPYKRGKPIPPKKGVEARSLSVKRSSPKQSSPRSPAKRHVRSP